MATSENEAGKRMIWDAARTFYLSKAVGGPIDVNIVRDGVVDILRRKGETPEWRTDLFTPCDSKNVAQRRYIDTFKNVMDPTTVHTVEPWELDAANPQLASEGKSGPRHLSFSSRIAFYLGAFWAEKNSERRPARVMLVSDCYDLAEPVSTCAAAGIPVALVWIGMYLDARWKNVLQQPGVDFFDLSMLKNLIVDKAAFEGKRGLNPFD